MRITHEQDQAQELCCGIYNAAMRLDEQSQHQDLDAAGWGQLWEGAVERVALCARDERGAPIGILAAARYADPSDCWVMQLLAAAPGQQGQGVGSALLGELKAIAARQGQSALLCAVKAHARGAQAFYAKARGRIDRSELLIDLDGDPIHLVRWRIERSKALGAAKPASAPRAR